MLRRRISLASWRGFTSGRNNMRACSLLFSVLLLTVGCSLPQWRFGQTKIPTDSGPPPKTIEAQRQAAALIVDLSTAPAPDPVARITEIHRIAQPLSASLGEPLRRAQPFEAPQVIAANRAGLLTAQAQAAKWREFSRKYAGQPIEDTGINLAGPAGLLGLLVIAAACIACPPIGYLLLRALPILWGYFRTTTAAVSEFSAQHPDSGANLKATLSRKMDTAHKRLVRLRAA